MPFPDSLKSGSDGNGGSSIHGAVEKSVAVDLTDKQAFTVHCADGGGRHLFARTEIDLLHVVPPTLFCETRTICDGAMAEGSLLQCVVNLHQLRMGPDP